jgi:hypothetical protein
MGNNTKRKDEDELRFRKHRITLNNQSMVEMAYLTRDLLNYVIGKKLTYVDDARCYTSCFGICAKLLKVIKSKKYRKRHEKLIEFYEDERLLVNEGEVLTWVNP